VRRCGVCKTLCLKGLTRNPLPPRANTAPGSRPQSCPRPLFPRAPASTTVPCYHYDAGTVQHQHGLLYNSSSHLALILSSPWVFSSSTSSSPFPRGQKPLCILPFPSLRRPSLARQYRIVQTALSKSPRRRLRDTQDTPKIGAQGLSISCSRACWHASIAQSLGYGPRIVDVSLAQAGPRRIKVAASVTTAPRPEPSSDRTRCPPTNRRWISRRAELQAFEGLELMRQG
jgi:hypothetical protein